MELGNIMKEERERQGLSQRDLAERAGVTKRAIYYWEEGTRNMTVESADKVFRALGVTIVIGKK